MLMIIYRDGGVLAPFLPDRGTEFISQDSRAVYETLRTGQRNLQVPIIPRRMEWSKG